MTDDELDPVEFDELVALALAQVAQTAEGPGPEVRARLMARLGDQRDGLPAVPAGFEFRLERDNDWRPHPVPGIRMKVLARNDERGYVTLLLDVAPGVRFPPHHHSGAEECYVVSGTLQSCGRTIGAGDFLHADAHTDHGELYTENGCRVLLVVPPEDYM